GSPAASRTSVRRLRLPLILQPVFSCSLSMYLGVVFLAHQNSNTGIKLRAQAGGAAAFSSSPLTMPPYVPTACATSNLELFSLAVCASRIDPGPNSNGLPQFDSIGISVVNETTTVSSPDNSSVKTGSHSKVYCRSALAATVWSIKRFKSDVLVTTRNMSS